MKKGIYEIFTTLFFIIIILFALFTWLGVSGTINIIKAEEGNQRLAITAAREAYSTISRCGIMNESEIPACINQDFDFVSDIYVEVQEVGDCTRSVFGELSGDDRYPYWITIEQNNSVCIAQVVIGI